jgi:hypothetical protein
MSRSSDAFLKQFRAARRVSTPILNVRTPNPESSLRLIKSAVKEDETPLVQWDTVRGVVHHNEAGRHEISRLLGEIAPSTVISPIEVLTQFYRAADDTILFLSNAHRFWSEAAVVQGIWNTRDVFKAHGVMLVLLSVPGALLPPELVQDVLTLDEPLPGPQDLERIVFELYRFNDFGAPDTETAKRAVDALIGLKRVPCRAERRDVPSQRRSRCPRSLGAQVPRDRGDSRTQYLARQRDLRRHWRM